MTTPGESKGEPALVALLDERVAGQIHRDGKSRLRLVYDEGWRAGADSYPLSLCMPLTASEHGHKEVEAFLWGLLPDNPRTLAHYGRLFGVSPKSPVAILQHIGADCAGAVQLLTPDRVKDFEGPGEGLQVEWIDTEEIARELRTVKETGLPSQGGESMGRFSLAGAQPKIALLKQDARWGRPRGRTPTTHILKPPSNEYASFAENEHLCLALAMELGLGVARSEVTSFGDEIAIVIERFDRRQSGQSYRRIHQEDVCQAMAILPWNKYENEGGPGVADIVALIQESSLEPEVDVGRFLDVIGLNWVIAATDGHAKNYSVLHVPGGGVRLAPFYDIASFLPYTDHRLFRITMAMRIGKEYLVRRVNRDDWSVLAKAARLPIERVLERLHALLARIPERVAHAADTAIASGLQPSAINPLRQRIIERAQECLGQLS